MTYRISNNRNYLLLEFQGNTSLEENKLAREQVVTDLNEKGIEAVLVDMTTADLSDVTLKDVVNFGKSWDDVLVSLNTKFATLVPCENPFRNKVDLSFTVTTGIQLKIFEDKALAIEWLDL